MRRPRASPYRGGKERLIASMHFGDCRNRFRSSVWPDRGVAALRHRPARPKRRRCWRATAMRTDSVHPGHRARAGRRFGPGRYRPSPRLRIRLAFNPLLCSLNGSWRRPERWAANTTTDRKLWRLLMPGKVRQQSVLLHEMITASAIRCSSSPQ